MFCLSVSFAGPLSHLSSFIFICAWPTGQHHGLPHPLGCIPSPPSFFYYPACIPSSSSVTSNTQVTAQTRNPPLSVTGTAYTPLSLPPGFRDAGSSSFSFSHPTLDFMPMDTPAGAAQDSIMTDSTIPSTTSSPKPNPATGESTQTQVNGTTTTTPSTTTTTDLSVTATTHLVTEVEKVVLTNANSISQDLILSDIAHAPILSAAGLLPQDPSSLIESRHVAMTPSIPSVDLTPMSATVPTGFGVSILPGLDLSVNAANDEFIVMDNGLITGAWTYRIGKLQARSRYSSLKVLSIKHWFLNNIILFSRNFLVLRDLRSSRFWTLEYFSNSSDNAGCTDCSDRRLAAKQCPAR